VETITVFSEHKDEKHEVLLCNNLPTLLWLAQSGTLEFHVWHSRAKPGPDATSKSTDYASSAAALEGSVLNYPDYVVFDIDPYIYSGKEAPGAEPELNTVAFEKGKEVAFWLRELLQSMSLEPSSRPRARPACMSSFRSGAHSISMRAPRVGAGGPAFDARPSEGHHDGMECAQAHGEDLHGLQYERPRQDAERRLLAKRRAPVRRCRCRSRGKNLRGRTHSISELPTRRKRLMETGDRWHDALKRKQSLERALDRAKA